MIRQIIKIYSILRSSVKSHSISKSGRNARYDHTTPKVIQALKAVQESILGRRAGRGFVKKRELRYTLITTTPDDFNSGPQQLLVSFHRTQMKVYNQTKERSLFLKLLIRKIDFELIELAFSRIS